MPQPQKKGTVHVDIGELEALAQRLEKLRDTFHAQRLHIPSLKDELLIAISGTASNIGKFDQQFDQWMQMLQYSHHRCGCCIPYVSSCIGRGTGA